MATELTTTERKALAKLGKQATKHHRLCLKSLGDAVYNANMSGAFLIQAKKGVPHGEWLDWLVTDFPDGCEKTAENYMKISRNWTELEQNRNAVANWSIRGVLKFLTKPREPEPLALLPPEQREACQKDYREECEATGEEPTAEGLQEAVKLYQADNEPYDAADVDSDASEPDEPEGICPKCGGCGDALPCEPESPACSVCGGSGEAPTETPAPPPEAAVSTPASVGHQFRIDEKARILKWVRTHGEHATMACWAESLAAAIRSEG